MKVCEIAGLTFSPKMTQGWKHKFINVVNMDNEDETANSAWTSEVWNSEEIAPNTRPQLDLKMLPKRIREHILGVAQPVYQSMTGYSQVGDDIFQGRAQVDRR